MKGNAAPRSVLFIYSDPDNEGEEYSGLAYADAQGKFSWSGTVKGPHVTAVAVDTTTGETTYNTSPFSTPFVVTGISESNEKDLPNQFGLSQNYPNPFNPSTKIGLRVSGLGSGWVKLAVFDLLGREVAVLVNEPKAPGEYQLTFDGAGLASGVYWYRMTAGSYVETKRMLLIR